MGLRAQAVTLSTTTFTAASQALASYRNEVVLGTSATAVLTMLDGATRALLDVQANCDPADPALTLIASMLTAIGTLP